MPERPNGGSSRKPVNPELPAAVRELLTLMETAADDTGLGFPAVLRAVAAGGGPKLQPPTTTRWRDGTAFPARDVVRRWMAACGTGPEPALERYEAAEAAFAAWRPRRRRPAVDTTGTDDTGTAAADPPATPTIPAPSDPAPSDPAPPVLAPPVPAPPVPALAVPAPSSPAPTGSASHERQPERQHERQPERQAERRHERQPERRAGRRRAVVAVLAVAALLAAVAAWALTRPDGGVAAARPVPLSVPPCAWPQLRLPPLPTASFVADAGRALPLMYKVPSGDGSRDVPVLAGGTAMQPFVATAARIDAAAVIVGVDPARADPRRPHPIRIEIVDPDPAAPTPLGAETAVVTPDNGNKDVAVAFAPPLTAIAGHVYVLRVTNLDPVDVIGVYTNRRDGPERQVPYPQDVCITGSVGPFDRTARSLAGYISAVG